jgi:hypothetical protein
MPTFGAGRAATARALVVLIGADRRTIAVVHRIGRVVPRAIVKPRERPS